MITPIQSINFCFILIPLKNATLRTVRIILLQLYHTRGNPNKGGGDHPVKDRGNPDNRHRD